MLNLEPVSERIYNAAQKEESSDGILIGLCFCMNHGLKNQNQLDLMLEAVKYADRSGFHFAWIVDEYLHASTGVKLNPAIFHSAISVLTSRIELRGECLVPAKRDSIRTAEDWSIIDNLSNGRIGLMVPFHSGEPSFGDSFVNHTNELRGLWKGDSIKRINGVGKEVDLKIFPRPIQEELPVWVPIVNNDRESDFRKAGESGFNLLTSYGNGNHQKWLSNIEHYRNAISYSGNLDVHDKVTVVVDIYDSGDGEEQDSDKTSRSSSDVDGGDNNLLKLAGSGHSKISESDFFEFYENIQKTDLKINEIAFKIDLTRGAETVFKQLKRLEKCFDLKIS